MIWRNIPCIYTIFSGEWRCEQWGEGMFEAQFSTLVYGVSAFDVMVFQALYFQH